MKLRWWVLATVLTTLILLLTVLGGVAAYIGKETTVLGDFVSPDRTLDAVVMVRNGGAMTGYATAVSLVRASNPFARELALIERPNIFVVDDNDGAVRWGDRGQLDLRLTWVSNNQLLIQYPSKARVFKQVASFQTATIRYAPAP